MSSVFKNQLPEAERVAQAGRFAEMQAICHGIINGRSVDADELLDIGTLLLSFGWLSSARKCFELAHSLKPDDLRAVVNLANLATDAGEHSLSRQRYGELLKKLPGHPVIRRNALVSLEYDPDVSDGERIGRAREWGAWAITQAGGYRPRPKLISLSGRALRIGYVSADICQHTVGLLIKDVLKRHDPERVSAFVYGAGRFEDWVTKEIKGVTQFREVSAVNDLELADWIREDRIDVLIDLSGHTAGSRLMAFAHRPAPVMVSWLGYFATTGLPYIDAVLMDEWHAPVGAEAQFVEPILRLPGGKFCYQPVPWAPTNGHAPPCLDRRFITFGSFNNTGKYNSGVFDLWARILSAVQNSRLVLKWRTFNDELFRKQVINAFKERGIAQERIELRGPSFHADLLKEYADIDIALDPFPFSGGLTSCEALWMGVPVITWPQSRVVSRQGYAILSQIGLPEFSASDADDYVRLAVGLANDPGRLAELRSSLRDKMRPSLLMDVKHFTCELENVLIGLYEKIETQEKAIAMTPKIILHVGAGHPKSGARIPPVFRTAEWKEIRLDIDPVNEPDILGTLLDMSAVANESVDAIYSAHTIEHLYPSEIPAAMAEFLRVLRPDGFAVINCPDLQEAARWIVEDKLMETAYTSQAGPVTPFDIVFSHRQFTGRDKPFMAHHCGFTLKVLLGTLRSNGFQSVGGKRRPAAFDLWAVASRQVLTDVDLRALADKVLPGG